MDLQEIEVTISKNGSMKIHVRGVKGDACLELTKSLEDSLGGKVILRELTPEAYDPNTVNQNVDSKQQNRAKK
jgi:hypothetical protein